MRSPAVAIEAPNAIAVIPTRRTELSVRRATASAPTSDPRLSTENSHVKVASVPPRSTVTSSGTTTWKLNASVPITAIITSGIHNRGTLRA